MDGPGADVVAGDAYYTAKDQLIDIEEQARKPPGLAPPRRSCASVCAAPAPCWARSATPALPRRS